MPLRPLKSLVVKEIYIEDLQQDTLLNLEELVVNFSLSEIWNRKVCFNHIGINGLTARILMDSLNSNYGFILDAFVAQDTSVIVKDEEQQLSENAWELIFHHSNLNLHDIDVIYDDKATKTLYDIQLEELKGITNDINLTKNEFDIREIVLKKAKLQLIIPDGEANDTTTTVYDYDVLLHDLKLEELDLQLEVAGMDIQTNRSFLQVSNGQFNINDSLLFISFPI